MRNPGSRPQRRKSLARNRISGPILAGALLALPGFAAAEELRPYAVTGDAIPLSLTGAPGDPVRGRATTVKRQSTCILCHSGPFAGREIPGRPGAQPRRLRQPLVRRPAAAAAGRCLQPQSRNDHAVLLPHRRIGTRRPGMARQADPVGRADRGRGGISRKPARIGSELDEERIHTTSVSGPRRQRRCPWCGAAGDVATRRRDTSVHDIGDPSRRWRSHGADRKSKTRRAATGRERQHRADDGHASRIR